MSVYTPAGASSHPHCIIPVCIAGVLDWSHGASDPPHHQYTTTDAPVLFGSGKSSNTQAIIDRLFLFLWEQIQAQLVKADAELKPMVKGVPQTTAECHTSLMKIVSDYCRLLRQVRGIGAFVPACRSFPVVSDPIRSITVLLGTVRAVLYMRGRLVWCLAVLVGVV